MKQFGLAKGVRFARAMTKRLRKHVAARDVESVNRTLVGARRQRFFGGFDSPYRRGRLVNLAQQGRGRLRRSEWEMRMARRARGR